jgi:tRNA/tmRNA/rRNA uracil-C5-methylase (TrmA/RlmC/RlmD family)
MKLNLSVTHIVIKVTYLHSSIHEGEHPRAVAPCKYFGKCGGCLLQHFTKETYEEFKLNLALHALSSETLMLLI